MVYRAALIGLGNIAWEYDNGNVGEGGLCRTHLSTFRNREDIDVLIGFDPDPDVRKRWSIATGVPACDSLEQLFDACPSIVSICSPNKWHADHLEACISARVPMVWLEKPATIELTETKRLASLAKSNECTRILVGFQRRYLPAYIRLRELFLDAEKVHAINITYSRGLETNGVHLIDLLFFLVGSQCDWKLSGISFNAPPAYANERSPSFLIELDSKIPCTVTGLDCDYHSIDISVHTDAGRASILYGGQRETWEPKIENPLFPGFRCLGSPISTSNPAQLAIEIQSAFPAMLNDLVCAHRESRDPISNMGTALSCQALIDAVMTRLD